MEQIFDQEFNQSKKYFRENWEGRKRGVLLVLVECLPQVGLRYGKYWIWTIFFIGNSIRIIIVILMKIGFKTHGKEGISFALLKFTHHTMCSTT
jgi:hypothetical protein